MSRASIQKSWVKELAIQKKLRAQIAWQQRTHDGLLKERVRLLKVGGVGWASALSKTNVKIEQSWDRLRKLLLKLYTRRVPT